MTALLSITIIGGMVILGAIVGIRALDAATWRRTLTAYRLQLPAQLTTADVANWLGMVAAATHPPRWSMLPLPPWGLEIVATASGIEHYVLVPESARAAFMSSLHAGLPGTRVDPVPNFLTAAPRFLVATEMTTTSRQRPLAVERVEATSTAFLASLQPLTTDQEIRYQVLMTSAGTPDPVHSASPNPDDRWWATYLVDGVPPADAEAVSALRRKRNEPLLRATIRLGVIAPTRAQALRLLGRGWPPLHGENAPGVRVVRRWLPSSVVVSRLANRTVPVLIWPLQLGARELSGLVGLPTGAGVLLPGLSLAAARQLPPLRAIPRAGTVLAVSNYPGASRPLAIGRIDRTRHLHVLGPVGTGKSTFLGNISLQDISSGAGVVVIDPKNDLVTELLARIPADRRDDVIVLNPAATDRPIGFNVLGGLHSETERELAVDHVVHIMSSIWRDSWGPRTGDVLRNALLTLTHSTAPDGSVYTLVEVPDLLANPTFRRHVTGQRGVPDTVRPFWYAYEQMSDNERANVIGPSLNKLRALTTRSSLRLMLGQSTGFDMVDVFQRRRILLVPLSKGLVGTETANLLGAFLVALLYRAALSRVAIPAEHRSPVYIHIDEFQDVLRLPVDIPDMLAQVRGLNVGLTLAHQFLDQLPALVKAALGTVRSSVVFQLDYDDARTMEKRFAPLTTDDLMNLAQYEVALRLSAQGQTQRPVTGTALPLPLPITDGAALADASRQRFGVPRAVVEAAIKARITSPGTPGAAAALGRRVRGGTA
jgi:hypothetical protein